jgi:hypothetical protein
MGAGIVQVTYPLLSAATTSAMLSFNLLGDAPDPRSR